ncbi:MAG TPA: UDP-3-O-(3-hydroxymyristoyl)glucosamine N-acyltransferase [Geopsychrobacteraceae bacterium]|nr:UDP-3-O-(3-hydroxymyristoyl)glucosamine N-acyltransferase [Geopsychrobacteraceae bacterium]
MATLQQLADLVGGKVEGDSGLEISRVSPIDSAVEGDITFLSNPKYLPLLSESNASAVIVAPGVKSAGQSLLVCANPYLAFARILTHLHQSPTRRTGILPGSHVAETARCSDNVTIHPGCVIGENVAIGSGTILYPNVIIYDDVEIGENCILHAGSVVREDCRLGNRVILQPSAIIGSDGFGFAPDGSRYFKIPQVGVVVLEDDVEIGSCACVDRAALGETRISRGTKLDNLVQIGHNVVVGEDTVMAAQTGIAGSTKIGNHCTFGGQSAVTGHVRVGDNVIIAGRAGVTNVLEGDEKPQMFSGLPAIPHKEWLKASMSFVKLPRMRKEIKTLQKQIEQLQSKLEES